jgi:Domain of unknown function (DUF4276)
VSAILYLEGGGGSKDLHVRCREGFRRLLEQCGFQGRMPRLSACGGRASAFDDFKTAHANKGAGDYVALWIDSEEPLADIEAAWKHLGKVKTVHRWKAPRGASDDQVLFMTTCMETWIVADRAALKKHYGSRLQASALAPLVDLEQRSRHDVQDNLAHATRNCPNVYAKGKRSFEILGKLAPAALAKSLPSFVRVHRILKAKL